MKKPDTPNDEPARLKTLRSLGILDTPPEERFDRLTRLAKRLFKVPVALVTLVDENRQWFKSCNGVDFREGSRDTSFCGHAIHGDQIFIIPDAIEDERFADNPLVVNDPCIRFYAGCPLKAADGSKLGTLCIIDHRPKHFDKDDQEALADLASIAEREISAVELATTDELTSVWNRRGFMMLAEQGLNWCKREKLTATLVYLDLDSFKPINDRFGHAEGDLALTVFADQLKNVFRKSDIIARLGGDEFTILLFNTSKESAEQSVVRLRQSLDKINRDSQRGYDISFSHGVAEWDFDSTIESLLEKGDELMYQTKRSI